MKVPLHDLIRIHLLLFVIVIYNQVVGERSLSISVSDHYENTSMQYTAIFHDCKNVNFQMIFPPYFSYICSKH